RLANSHTAVSCPLSRINTRQLVNFSLFRNKQGGLLGETRFFSTSQRACCISDEHLAKSERDLETRKSLNDEVSRSISATKKHRLKKKSDKELTCPECEYRTQSVPCWINHLRRKHSTTPALAGLALLCECGHESISEYHSYHCTIGNFTVIRKREGPIRRLDSQKETPPCVLCDAYPTTPLGYVHHLHTQHSSTLRKNQVFLICECGFEVRGEHSLLKHNKKVWIYLRPSSLSNLFHK
ncbi:hypothetical protein PENTCL1PPCAC_20964, partial [Pristionchus entomophagus]